MPSIFTKCLSQSCIKNDQLTLAEAQHTLVVKQYEPKASSPRAKSNDKRRFEKLKQANPKKHPIIKTREKPKESDSKTPIVVDENATPKEAKSVEVEPHVTTGEEAAAARNALFAELNKGDGVKSHLTHLTTEEKQKRRAAAKKAGGVVHAPKSPTVQKPKPDGPPPFFECVADREWVAENHFEGVHEISADQIKFKHAVTIRDCRDTTFVIHGKCSNLLLDNCTKTNVVFNGVMAGVEMIRCKQSNVQIATGTCATFTLDHTHSGDIYLNPETKGNTSFTTTCCSGINIWFPSKNDPEEMVCKPIPEQFTSVVDDEDEVNVRVSDIYLAD